MHMERPTIRSGLQFLERVKARTVRSAAFGTHKYAGFRILEIMEGRILQSFYFALHCDTDKDYAQHTAATDRHHWKLKETPT